MTPTLEQRRATIPAHRRKAQVQQTVWGVVIWAAGSAFVYLIHAPMLWFLVVFLFALRIANRDLLMDCLKIARDLITFQRGNSTGGSNDAP